MSLEGETPPNSNVLFPVVFENKVSTPLFMQEEKLTSRRCFSGDSTTFHSILIVRSSNFHWQAMAQYSDHITPVLICLLGLSISAMTNVVNLCCHHDRPFQLLSTQSVRLNIIIPIVAPFILIGETILFMFVSHFNIA
jgi:hypothetical protein